MNAERRPGQEAATRSAVQDDEAIVAQRSDNDGEAGFLRDLADLGVPIFTAPPGGSEFHRPDGWQHTDPGAATAVIAAHRPGDAICAVTGARVAVVDVDTRNGGDPDAVQHLLTDLGVTVFAEVATPGGGRHFYVAGHPELATAHNLRGYPGIDVQSHGANVFLPGTVRPKYHGRGYRVIANNLGALGDGGDRDGAELLAGWVAEHRGQAEAFTPCEPWDGAAPDKRQSAYLDAVVANTCARIAAMGPDSGRNIAVYQAGMLFGNYVAGAGLDEHDAAQRLYTAAQSCALVADDGKAAVVASIRSGLRNGRARPRAVPADRTDQWLDQLDTAVNVDHETGEITEPATLADELAGDRLLAQEVADQLRRARARVIVAELEARRSPQQRPDVGTLTELLQRPQEPPWRVHGLLPAGGRMLLTAQRKTGKTTMTGNLTRSLLTGDPFLDRFPVRALTGTVVALNYEVTGATYARWMDQVGVPPQRMHVVNLRGRRNLLTDQAGRTELAGLIRAAGGDVLVVDPFGRAYTGRSQNDAAEVTPWLVMLDQLAEAAGITEVVLAAHAGWDGERTRGSSALEDWADVVVTVTRDPDTDQRFLRAEGRDVDVDEDALHYDASTRRLTLTGTGSRSKARAGRRSAELVDALVQVVTADPRIGVGGIERALRDAGVPFQKGDVNRASHEAERLGRIVVETGPRRARIHSLPPTTPDYPHGVTVTTPDPPLYGGGSQWGGQASTTPEPELPPPTPPQRCADCGADLDEASRLANDDTCTTCRGRLS
jgi:hypothetical protein